MGSTVISLWQESRTLDAIVADLAETPFLFPLLDDIARTLVLLKAARQYQVLCRLDVDLQTSLINAFCRRQKVSDRKALDALLREQGKSLRALVHELYRDEITRRLMPCVVPDATVQTLFLTRKQHEDMVTFLLMRLPSMAIAQEVYCRLNDDGEDFTRLAQQYSVGAEAAYGGLVGPMSFLALNPELRPVLQALSPGALSAPFVLDDTSVMIVKLLRRDPAQLTEPKQTALRAELFDHWLNRQVQLANPKLRQDEESLAGFNPDIHNAIEKGVTA